MDERQMFDFEQAYAPVLNRRMLEKELERRRLQRQTVLLVVAAVFVELCLILTAFLLRTNFSILAAVCIGYVFCSSTGGGVLAVVFHIRKGKLICQK